MGFVTCYGCFSRVSVASYPCVHQACSALPLEPCNRCCGGGESGCGGCHCGGRPSGSGGCHGGSGPGFVRGGFGLDDEPCPTLPRGVCACTGALAVGRGICMGSVACAVACSLPDVGLALAGVVSCMLPVVGMACAGGYVGAASDLAFAGGSRGSAGGLAFGGGPRGSVGLACKYRTNIAMSLCAVAG